MEGLRKGKTGHIGKLQAERTIRGEVIRNTMLKIWRTSKPFSIQEIGTNMYICIFEYLLNMRRIVKGKHWLFYSFLLSLKPFDECIPPSRMGFTKEEFSVQFHDLPLGCMNTDIGTHIGNSLGQVMECDVDDNGNAGKVFRIRIEIDLLKTLSRGRTINVKGERLCVPITYEKLPRISFWCGKLVHGQRNCEGDGDTVPISTKQYGP